MPSVIDPTSTLEELVNATPTLAAHLDQLVHHRGGVPAVAELDPGSLGRGRVHPALRALGP